MADLDGLALELPQATKEVADDGRPTYLVHGKMFCFHRSRRPDAVDRRPASGSTTCSCSASATWTRRSCSSPTARGIFFTTPHWNGYPAVLIRIPDLERIDREELRELVVDAWLTRAQKRVAKAWLAEHEGGEE